MKLFDSENRYQEIWSYLSNHLSIEEESSLLDWVSATERNSVFFNEVVADFNSFQGLSSIKHSPSFYKKKKSVSWRYGIAAGFLLLVTASVLWITYRPTAAKTSEIILPGGITISSTDGALNYDLQNYMANGIIQITGAAWIHCPQGKSTIITVETSAGYYLLENAEAFIENNPAGNSSIQLFSGRARLIPKNRGANEVGIRVGQKIFFNKLYNTFTYTENTPLTSPI